MYHVFMLFPLLLLCRKRFHATSLSYCRSLASVNYFFAFSSGFLRFFPCFLHFFETIYSSCHDNFIFPSFIHCFFHSKNFIFYIKNIIFLKKKRYPPISYNSNFSRRLDDCMNFSFNIFSSSFIIANFN